MLSLDKQLVMVKFALLARLEAKAGKEKELAQFLKSALPLVQEEPGTVHWFGLQLGPSTFGIFDTFETEEDRKAHLVGKVAAALMAKAPELLAAQPVIEQVQLLAVDIK
jgi:quinol monooxygenase YgiN